MVSQKENIPIEHFLSETRETDIKEPRQISMYLCNKYTRKSLYYIAKIHGKKSHATVLSAIKRITNLIETEQKVKTKVLEYEQIIRQRCNLNVLTAAQ